MLTVSVIVATYNGAHCILEQLNSLRLQTHPADEVIIFDDNSTDATVQLVQKFISDYSLNGWRIVQNTVNLGWRKNFFNGFKIAHGDLIFPCDQDDIWHPDKIEVMCKAMEANNNIFVLAGYPHKWFCSGKCIEEQIDTTTTSLRFKIGLLLDKAGGAREKCGNTGHVSKIDFDEHFLCAYPGCVLAIRKSFFLAVKNTWRSSFPHDVFLTIYSKLIGHYYMIDYEVIRWRKHNLSATHSIERTKENRVNDIKQDAALIQFALNVSDQEHVCDRSRLIIRNALEWNSLREELIVHRKAFNAIKLLRYCHYYVQFRRYFTDLKYGIIGK